MLNSLFVPVLTLWALVTVAFIVVVIWKSLVGFREEDVVILNPAEANKAAEQEQIVHKVEQLASWAKRFGFASLAFLVLAGGLWVYRAMMAFNGRPE